MSAQVTITITVSGETQPVVATPGYADALLYKEIADLKAQLATRMPAPQFDCKARRFLLVDEEANITEGVKWANGRVMLETGFYQDWETLKATFQGSGVQWVDQEVQP